MKKIYGALLSRAGRTNWVAHECGLEFEQVHVPTGVPAEEKPADFMTINPAGTMPVYQDLRRGRKNSWTDWQSLTMLLKDESIWLAIPSLLLICILPA
jgi:glutathione S-transferase